MLGLSCMLSTCSMCALTVDDHRWLLSIGRIAIWQLWIGWCIAVWLLRIGRWIAIALGRALDIHDPFLLGS